MKGMTASLSFGAPAGVPIGQAGAGAGTLEAGFSLRMVASVYREGGRGSAFARSPETEEWRQEKREAQGVTINN